MKHAITITLVSTFTGMPAFADHTFETEVQVVQDKGMQLNGIVRWILPNDTKNAIRFGTHLVGGGTENSRLTSATILEPENFLFAGGGVSLIGKTTDPKLSAVSDLTLGIDGINLKTSSGDKAGHMLFKVHTAARFESENNSYFSAGISFFNRRLPGSEAVFVNGQLLTKYSFSPTIGFGAQL